MKNPPSTPAWAEVSLKAIRSNFKALGRLAKGSRVLPVVKANAYGHGLIPVSKTLIQAGARFLAVAWVQEGIRLRQAGIKVPILVLLPTLRPEWPLLLRYRLIPQISSLESARQLDREAQKQRIRVVPIHLKMDTGMARVGFQTQEMAEMVEALQKLPSLKVEGIYTHLATADWTDPLFAWNQITLFKQTLEKIYRKTGLRPATHVANSAALITYYPQSKGQWVRPGIAVYGIYPNPKMKNLVSLTPAMSLRARVLHAKSLKKGESISYGRTYRASKRMQVATLGLGYADGLLRSLSNRGVCLLHGKRVPLVGTVCMDMVMADVSRVPGVKPGDIATFFGRDGGAFLPVEEQASLGGTISYEWLTAVGERIPRIYID